jgi:hypothetical protein
MNEYFRPMMGGGGERRGPTEPYVLTVGEYINFSTVPILLYCTYCATNEAIFKLQPEITVSSIPPF